MTGTTNPRIAVIGAGMAGLACAHALRQRGLSPVVFEKSRGIGGRLATRRTEHGDGYDHGAQFVTAREAGFTALLETLQHAGAAATWSPRLPAQAPRPTHAWWIGTAGMSSLVRPLSASLDIRLRTTVSALQRQAGRWELQLAEQSVETFDAVVITTPAPQAQALLAGASRLADALESVAIAACWAVMLGFDAPWAVPFDAARFDTGAIAWIARQSSRDGLPGQGDRWLLHAAPDWSTAHLEHTPEEVLVLLQSALATQTRVALPPLSFAQAHRWRYAMTTRPLGQPMLAEPSERMWVGGDWCLGARVENACQSGLAIADAVAASL
ncbi:NAD(P)/FAD-dependent oxidoreductase [Dyella sp.]|jgi:predicted NAD/FAD-dependent oxidoreductase|uniref:NAD(P)/FAD-dependent oxidoreductase n=1 Tax=Dyella sp. TaxID=1869338 RepID=UPI002D772C2A|nr:FAD-dependent oxidoreductase [Dyella sp.]HET6432208.1 FAD-dependent oxidoreductase [Dyella sp.]